MNSFSGELLAMKFLAYISRFSSDLQAVTLRWSVCFPRGVKERKKKKYQKEINKEKEINHIKL